MISEGAQATSDLGHVPAGVDDGGPAPIGDAGKPCPTIIGMGRSLGTPRA